MQGKNNYPEHLSQQIRIQIAGDYIKQDFRKILPVIRGQNEWSNIDGEINKWFEDASAIGGVRDFWNRFYGIAMGGKLKNGLQQVITAENIQWQLVEQLPMDESLASGGGLGYIHPLLDKRRLRASEFREFVRNTKNSDIANHWRTFFTKQSALSESRDEFPIIVCEEFEEGETLLSIHDGNRRMAQRVLNEQTTIRAYIGRYVTPVKKPQNYWLPTSFLMEIVKETELLDTEKAYQHTLGLLKDYIQLSESGKYELLERVLIGNNPLRQRLKADLFKDK